MRYLKFTLIGLIFLAAIAVVAQDEITFTTSEGQVVRAVSATTEPFNSLNAWENFVSPEGAELGVDRGVYRAYSETEGYVWGLNDTTHTDAVIEADVLLMNIFTENGYGLICRAAGEEADSGYFFMLNSNGYFAIFRGEEQALTPLVDWTPSDAVHAGIDSNHMQAICYGDYLALYANGELLAETNDDTFVSGYTGLAVAAADNPVDVAFDNVGIYQLPRPRP